MSKIFVSILAAATLLVFATAATSASTRIEGTVAATFPANQLIRVDARRTAFILRVPGSQSRIRVGQRVELRGTTLRRRGNGSGVLARGVTIASSVPKGSSLSPGDDDPGRDDDTDDPTDDTTDDTDDTSDDDTTDDDDKDSSGHGGDGSSGHDGSGNSGPGGGDN